MPLGLKDLKRRGVESFLQAISVSDKTTDATYNEEYEAFQMMVSDLNEIGAGLSEYLISLKSNYGLGSDLAEVLDDFYNGQFNRGWIKSNPNLSHLTLHREVESMREAWHENDEVVRKSVAHIWLQRGLTPMRAFVNMVMPEIEEACTTRENYRKDADSYRRRYAAAQKKAAITSLSAEKKAEADAMSQLLYNKLTNASKLYDEKNESVKKDLEKSKIARDEAIELMSITVAACQMELYEQSYLRLQKACANFPQEKMNQVRTQVRNVIRAGGPAPTDGGAGGGTFEGAMKVANVVSGKKKMGEYEKEGEMKQMNDAQSLQQAREIAMADDIKRNKGEVMASPGVPAVGEGVVPRAHSPIAPTGGSKGPPPPVPSKFKSGPPAVPAKNGAVGTVANMPGMGKRFSVNTPPYQPMGRPAAVPAAGTAAPTPTNRAPPPPNKKTNTPTCTAIFDNEADDDDELSFAIGDKIQIIKKDDSGWWDGKLNGKSGTFPANFVKED